MKHFKLQYFLVGFSLLVIYSCKDSGGIWVEDGSSYKFGNDKMSSNLISLAEAYSARDPEKLFTFYSDSFLTDKFRLFRLFVNGTIQNCSTNL